MRIKRSSGVLMSATLPCFFRSVVTLSERQIFNVRISVHIP